MRLNTEKWIYNMLTDCIRGGANAVSASAAVALSDPTYSVYGHKFYMLIATVFAAHFVINLSHYLEKTPLPEEVPNPSELTSGPAAKV